MLLWPPARARWGLASNRRSPSILADRNCLEGASGASFSRSCSSRTRSCCCSGRGHRPTRSRTRCARSPFFRIRPSHSLPCSTGGLSLRLTCPGLIFRPISPSHCRSSSLFSCCARRSLPGSSSFATNSTTSPRTSAHALRRRFRHRLSGRFCDRDQGRVVRRHAPFHFCTAADRGRRGAGRRSRHAHSWRAFRTGGRFMQCLLFMASPMFPSW